LQGRHQCHDTTKALTNGLLGSEIGSKRGRWREEHKRWLWPNIDAKGDRATAASGRGCVSRQPWTIGQSPGAPESAGASSLPASGVKL